MNPLDFEHLFDSMLKCKANVLWKESVGSFYLNGIDRVMKLAHSLSAGSYRARPPKTVHIMTPKKREAISIAFQDRVYQRSLNDNIVYPAMTRGFIYDNAACQKGKGTTFARNRLKCHMQRYFRKYGMDGWVLQCDIKHYYDNMQHDSTKQLFLSKLPPEYSDRVCCILDEQYAGDIGFAPGSQIVQIAGISVLDRMDHRIKEELRIKYYDRYMDDFILIHNGKDYLEYCKGEISKELSKIGLELHPAKSKIYPLSDGISFLGFRFRLTDTGKVVVSVLGHNVKREKRKLRKMVRLAQQGVLTREKVDECYASWKAHASYGDSYNLLQRMDDYYNNLWRFYETDTFYISAKGPAESGSCTG